MITTTALMDDLEDVCVRDYVARLIESGRYAVRAVREGSIGKHERDTVTAAVTGSHAIDAEKLDEWNQRFPRLKMLSLAFTGTDRVKRDECRKRKLSVYYVPGYATEAVAEHAIGLALAVLRKIVIGHNSAKDGSWHDGRDGRIVPGYLLRGRRIGIIGTGPIGMKVAEKFKAMGCSSLRAWTPEHPDKPEFLALEGKYVKTVDDLFAECDIVTLHVKSTRRTWRIASRERIVSMNSTSVLINTGRGRLVDNHALAEALQKHSILGAGIDVFDTDPIRGEHAVNKDPLLSLPSECNLVATPHVAFKEDLSLQELAKVSLDNVKRWTEDPNDATNRLNLDSIEE